jgi:hypothetical protein
MPSVTETSVPTTVEKNTNFSALSTPTSYNSIPISKLGNQFIIPGFGQVPSKGYSFVLYSHGDDRNTLVLLAESQNNLIDLLELINKGSLKGCMIQDRIAVCPGVNVVSGLEKTSIVATPTPSPTTRPQTTPVG